MWVILWFAILLFVLCSLYTEHSLYSSSFVAKQVVGLRQKTDTYVTQRDKLVT